MLHVGSSIQAVEHSPYPCGWNAELSDMDRVCQSGGHTREDGGISSPVECAAEQSGRAC